MFEFEYGKVYLVIPLSINFCEYYVEQDEEMIFIGMNNREYKFRSNFDGREVLMDKHTAYFAFLNDDGSLRIKSK